MNLFLQQLIEGIASGAIYASLALALVFSFRSTNVVNFAQGEMAMLSTYMAWQLVAWGMPLLPAAVITLVISFIGGCILYITIVHPLARASALTVVSMLIGLYIAMNSIAGFIWTHLIKSFPSAFPVSVFRFGQVGLSLETVGIVAMLVAIVLILYLLLEKTKTGLAVRAAASQPDGARLVGISVTTMLMAGWGVAATLGAISGMLVAPRVFLNPNMMMGIIIYAFAAATLGGFDSILGAVVGGLIVGIAENMVATYVPWIGADLKIVVALILIFATLLIQPAGLFGRRTSVRV